LPGQVVRAFALPWWRGSSSALEAARRSGYEFVFWGRGSISPRVGRQSINPMRIGRLDFDWTPCLAGEHRRGVARVLLEKAKGAHDVY